MRAVPRNVQSTVKLGRTPEAEPAGTGSGPADVEEGYYFCNPDSDVISGSGLPGRMGSGTVLESRRT